MEDPTTIRQLLSRHVDPDRFEIMRKLVYTFNALVAEHWRDRRVFLAGDAAHMTPQFMGQGMSSGVRDAYNLAWKLAAVLHGKAGDAFLDSYEQERRHHAKAMIDGSVRIKNLVSLSNPVAAGTRNALMKGLQALPPIKSFIREDGYKPKPRYEKGTYFGLARTRFRGVEGTLLPQPDVCDLEGRHLKLDDVLGKGFSLIGLGVDPRTGLTETSQAILDKLDTRYVSVYEKGLRPQGHNGVERVSPTGLQEVEEQTNLLCRWGRQHSINQGTIIIVRPDKFVFGALTSSKLENAIISLRDQLGASHKYHSINNHLTLQAAP